jgi:hypothetical protein
VLVLWVGVWMHVVLSKYVTSAEMKKLENIMPHNLKELFAGQAFSSAQTTTQATV